MVHFMKGVELGFSFVVRSCLKHVRLLREVFLKSDMLGSGESALLMVIILKY